jgi:ABC-2 type transport system permease protein
MKPGSFVDGFSISTKPAQKLSSLLRPPSLGEWFLDYLRGAWVVTEIEIRKLRHDPFEMITRAVAPTVWLVIYGQVLSQLQAIPTGNVSYLTFITPGFLAYSVMFTSIFYGLNIIWERDAGILQKFLVMPVPRASFVTGKGLGAGVRALTQVIAIFALALLLGVQLHWSIVGIVGSVLTILAGSSLFLTFSLLIAILMKTRERFMAIGQVIALPLFFASSAIYPLSIMPGWLRVVAQINPLSYIVDLLRGYLINGYTTNMLLDWAILLIAVLIVQAITAMTYHTIAL